MNDQFLYDSEDLDDEWEGPSFMLFTTSLVLLVSATILMLYQIILKQLPVISIIFLMLPISIILIYKKKLMLKNNMISFLFVSLLALSSSVCGISGLIILTNNNKIANNIDIWKTDNLIIKRIKNKISQKQNCCDKFSGSNCFIIKNSCKEHYMYINRLFVQITYIVLLFCSFAYLACIKKITNYTKHNIVEMA